jgi:hypothetical protein
VVRRRVCATALLVVLATACGGSPGSAGSTARRALVTGQQQVDRMVLADGDLPGYHVQSVGAEALSDQLPPPRAPQAALVARLVTANWVASEHSTLVGPAKAAPTVFSDANLFKSASALRRIWVLESGRVPGIQRHDLAVPPGAPEDALYAYFVGAGGASYQLSWPEGPAFGIVVVRVSARAHLSARARAKIASTLGRAARVESVRIAGAVDSSAATV